MLAGDADHIEPHAGAQATHEERLFTLLGMHTERAVGEAESIGFVDDGEDPARCVDVPHREGRAQRDVRAHRDAAIREQLEIRAAMPVPRPIARTARSNDQAGSSIDPRPERSSGGIGPPNEPPVGA